MRARRYRVVLPIAALLGGCTPAVLSPQGSVGIAEKQILIDSVVIMLVIVVPTMLATLGFAWWFRATNTRARHLPEWAHSGRIELVVWAIPLMVIILLGGVAWIGAHQLDPARKLPSGTPALEVQGVSLDWKWLFIYPQQGIASVNELEIPVGTPVHFSLTSASVMNVFFVPQLGSMIYTMNSMDTQLNLQADVPGTFRGQSSHFSGDGFSGMNFAVRAVSPQQFTAWANAAHGRGPTLNAASYEGLARQSMNVAPFTFGAADPGLFNQIVTQKLPPGPGPSTSDLSTNAAPPAVSPRTEP